VLDTGNIVCNDILLGGDMFSLKAHRTLEHDGALKVSKGLHNMGMFAHFCDP
jgi:hypothetical protein